VQEDQDLLLPIQFLALQPQVMEHQDQFHQLDILVVVEVEEQIVQAQVEEQVEMVVADKVHQVLRLEQQTLVVVAVVLVTVVTLQAQVQLAVAEL
tara:strand:- start:71 stop:355 length:285 start_codon:yes stop_codon:yes gene_type:complete